MPTITIRVDEQTKNDLEALARGRGLSVSDVLRIAVDTELGRETDGTIDVAPLSMSAVDRRSLSLLHRIHAHLMNPNAKGLEHDAEHELERAHVLESGFASEYSTEFAVIDHEFSRSESTLVMDILDMFTIIKTGLEAPENQPIDEEVRSMLDFRGFDRNDPRESRMLDYAQFLIADGRWTALEPVFSPESDRGNSHMPSLDLYRRLLHAFTPIRAELGRRRGIKGWVLTGDDLRTLAAAAIHPSHRSQ